jgi:HEAT repeat protein
MNTYPALTISLLDRLTNRELQSNYLNHLDRTAEIASLLTQITEPDLAMRIVNLALEVDLNLGASLTSFLAPELQKIIVDGIDRLEIPTRLKIELWSITKSKAALQYLQDIFIFKNRYWNSEYETIELAISSIINIDRDLAVALLIEDLYDSRCYDVAIKNLADLDPVEKAVEGLGYVLCNQEYRDNSAKFLAIDILDRIGTKSAIEKIHDGLNNCKCQWSDRHWVKALGILAEPAMVEHLIYLLYEPSLYVHRSNEYPLSNEYYRNEAAHLCCEAISALERIGGDKIFDLLHQAMYWNRIYDYPSPFGNIIEALFRLDRSRTFAALENDLKNYDPEIRKLAVIALAEPHIQYLDCNLSILLNAIDDSNLDVQVEITDSIRRVVSCRDINDITPELIDYAIFITKLIIINLTTHPDWKIRERVFRQLLVTEPDERNLMLQLLGDAGNDNIATLRYGLNDFLEPADLPILLTYLQSSWIHIKDYAVIGIGKIGDDSIAPILAELIHDKDSGIRQTAVQSIINLGNSAIFPTVLELAANYELVMTLINGLESNRLESNYLGTRSTILEEFYRDRSITLKFLETAEQSLLEVIGNKIGSIHKKIRALAEIGTDLAVPSLENLLKSRHMYQDISEDCVIALTQIGTQQSISILLEFLSEENTLGCYICTELLCRLGKLGFLPQIWLLQRQTYSHILSDAITTIQRREGLYNPDFSDRPHSLFEQPRLRLRDILLGNTTSEI